MIFTRRGTDIDQYPAVKGYLLPWRERLTPKQPGDPKDKPGRKPGDYKWFEIQDNIAYHSEFSQPKVVWPDIVRYPRFASDEEGAFVGNTAYILPGQPSWMLGILNSSLCNFVLACLSPAIRGGYLRAIDSTVGPLPIANVAETHRRELAGLVLAAEGAESSALQSIEDQIDSCCAGVYGLSKQEFELVTKWSRRRHAAYGDEDVESDEDDD